MGAGQMPGGSGDPAPPDQFQTPEGVSAEHAWPVWMLPLTAVVRPVTVVRRHLDRGWDSAAWGLFMLHGAGNAADRLSEESLGDRVGPLFLALLIVGGGVLFGPLSGLIYSAVLRLSSKAFRGRASMADLRAAIVWGMMPSLLITVAMWAIMLGMFGHSIFTSDVEASAAQATVLTLLMFVALGAGVWSVVNTSRAVGFVNGYSGWKGFLTLMLPGVVLIAIVLAVVWVTQATP